MIIDDLQMFVEFCKQNVNCGGENFWMDSY